VDEETAVLRGDEIESGTNVLVAGPVMTGKRNLLLSLVGAGEATDRGTVLVTTRQDAETMARGFRRVAGAVPNDRFPIIDCVTRANGFGRTRESPHRRYVTDPGDLTGIGIGLTEYLRGFHDDGVPARVGLHSLSTILMYADLRRVFQFVHVLTGRIASSEFVGVFAIDTTVPDSRDLEILKQPFDALVELRETEAGDREIRVRGADFGPHRWTDY
jgi:KaiC/GvpD/RAD55 family RecA-like ATPase